MMKKRELEWWPFVLFIGLTVCLMLMWSLRKEGWFLDEVYSYGLSNSTEGPFLTDLHADWEKRDLSVFDPGACGCCRNAAVFSVVVCAIAFTGKCLSGRHGHSCIGPNTVSHKNGHDANVAYA